MRNKWITAAIAGGVVIALLLAVLSIQNGRNAKQQGDRPEVPMQGKALGEKFAPVLVEVYSDYQCPYCAVAAKGFERDLARDYVAKGQVRLQFRDYPFIGLESYWAAIAAGCAANQNQFWAYHEKLFASQKGENQNRFSQSNLKQWAQELNLNMTDFNRCFDKEEVATTVREDYQSGQERGVNSTPTFFVNGRKFVGIPGKEEFAKAVAEELKKEK